jgi:hypothetical protein
MLNKGVTSIVVSQAVAEPIAIGANEPRSSKGIDLGLKIGYGTGTTKPSSDNLFILRIFCLENQVMRLRF